MRLDIKKAILSPFSDNKWRSKLFILCLLVIPVTFEYFVPNITKVNKSGIIYSLLVFPFFCIFWGYCIEFAHNEIHNVKSLLPEWDFKINTYIKYFKQGFLFIIIGVIFIIAIAVSLGLIEKCFFSGMKSVIFQFSRNLICYYIITIVPTAICLLYIDSFEFFSIFNLNKLLNLIFKAQQEFCISIIIFYILGCIFELIVSKLSFNFIGIIMTTIMIIITNLISNNLFAQTYKVAKEGNNDTKQF